MTAASGFSSSDRLERISRVRSSPVNGFGGLRSDSYDLNTGQPGRPKKMEKVRKGAQGHGARENLGVRP